MSDFKLWFCFCRLHDIQIDRTQDLNLIFLHMTKIGRHRIKFDRY